MTDMLTQVSALAWAPVAGFLLGVIFFGGLRWTIRDDNVFCHLFIPH